MQLPTVIDEEGERYIMIGAVVPQLLSTKAKIDTTFQVLNNNEADGLGIRNRVLS